MKRKAGGENGNDLADKLTSEHVVQSNDEGNAGIDCLNEKMREKILRNFRCLDSVMGGLNSRRTPAHLEIVLESVGRMIGEAFTEGDLATIVVLCPDAYSIKRTSNHLIAVSTNNYWPHSSLPHNTFHISAESRLHAFRDILRICTNRQLQDLPTLESLIVDHRLNLPDRSSKKRVKSNSLMQILDQVSVDRENSKPPIITSAETSVESLREAVIRRSELQSTKAQLDKGVQQKIDRLSVLSVLQTAGDLIKLLCRLQQKSIFPLQDVLKYLSSSLHLSPTFINSITSFPHLKPPSSYQFEYIILSKLSESVPEYITILPAYELSGVNYVTVRINVSAAMSEIREKLRDLSRKAMLEKKKLMSEVC